MFLVSKDFWIATVERSIKTFAQTLVAVLTGDEIGLLSVDWNKAAQVAALAAFISVLTSIGSAAAPVGPPNSPSVTKEV